MSDMGSLVRALIEGSLLGALFFGGLWWTVRHGIAARNPAVWFSLSAIARMGIVVAALYGVARGGTLSLLACLLGLLIARLGITRLTRPIQLERP